MKVLSSFSLFLALITTVSLPGMAIAAPPPPLEAYGELPAVEEIAISPSGSSLAILSKIRGKRTLLVTGEGGKARMMAPLEGTKVRAIDWAGDDMVVITTSVTEDLGILFRARKSETFGAIILHIDTGETAMVFKNKSGIADTVRGSGRIRKVDKEWKAYFPGIELKRQPGTMNYSLIGSGLAMYEVDLKKNAPSKVAEARDGGFWTAWLIDGAGDTAATLELNDSGQWTIKNAARAVIASGRDPTGDVGLLAFGASGSSVIYYVEDDSDGHSRWFEVPLAGGEAKEILAETKVDRIYTDAHDSRMLGYLDGSTGRPVMNDPKHQAILDKVFRAFPNGKLTVSGWTPDFSKLLVRTSGNFDSGTWFVVDMTKMKADPVANERPKIGPDQVGKISTFKYKASDGLDLDGILTLPPGKPASGLPVVVLPHGGPHAHDEEKFDWWAQAIASRGYAVFQPNFRGSTNRDDAFERAGYGQWGRKMQSDISDGLVALATAGIVNPKRACIMGGSYGGYAALVGVTLQQGLYRCAVAVAPATDLHDFYWDEVTTSGRSKVVRESWRESMGDPSTLREVSPRRFADRADAPILLIHGKDDTVVPFKQSDAMADALKRAGKPHELDVLRDEDHWLSSSETRQQMLQEALHFVLKHNPPD